MRYESNFFGGYLKSTICGIELALFLWAYHSLSYHSQDLVEIDVVGNNRQEATVPTVFRNPFSDPCDWYIFIYLVHLVVFSLMVHVGAVNIPTSPMEALWILPT